VYPSPSAQSAGNDLNKIMSIRVGSEMAVEMSLECLDMWKNDELFRPYYHEVGMVSCMVYGRDWRVMLMGR
jgi:sarcosine oxidase / L-pipecolate oxidase